MLTAGQVHDIQGGRALLAAVPPMRRLIADKAYDANDLRAFLAAQGTEAVISPMPTRVARPAFDPHAYRGRNLIERAFCRLKDWRAIATRYDKTACNFLAGVCLAVAITDWLRWVHALVYKIETNGGRSNYTGIAQRGRVQDRLAEHLPNGKDPIPGARVTVQPMTSIDDARQREARQREARIIKLSQPTYNKRGK